MSGIAGVLAVCLVIAGLLAAGPGAAAVPAKRTVWLCKPGLERKPCVGELDTTVVRPGGSISKIQSSGGGTPPVDCFYVYPTVSGQRTLNATRRIEPEQRSVARFQASRFSGSCRIFSPMYRQVTVSGLFSGGLNQEHLSIGYRDVRAAWRSYLRKHNRGRGVVLIGHSQGTGMLTRLVKEEIDPEARQRRKLISALLLGGDVTVRKNSDRGGDFKRVRACRSARQTGCVIAYNTFLTPPGPGAFFGRAGSLFLPRPNAAELEVLCTNPAALAGGSGELRLELPASDGWRRYTRLYSGRCTKAGGASWLQVTDIAGPADPRPRLTENLGLPWGLHTYDVSIALGNLVRLVERQSAAYLERRR
ncbi:MAG TPA: DUF3089 domain-containing protein [Thermoleophilaceae bacterium]|nr:DUF3089 domain-containing protein [Thermoleophilaceae bacterium]